ncbi:MAG: hypothetical protein E6G92_10320 [Alphaproteobacteria bacterium]|nr:MAG: hypothetical protein E6G92_10320 [Alphaproteobacteria bacterium]
MTKGLKIPKTVAGVKLPKKVRKRAKKAIKMGASPVVREIAAAAIGAAAGKAAGTGGSARRSEGGGRARIHFEGGEIGEAFRSAAVAGLQRFLEGFEEGLRGMKGRDEGGKKSSRRSA